VALVGINIQTVQLLVLIPGASLILLEYVILPRHMPRQLKSVMLLGLVYAQRKSS
jgi:hypothetical protein